MSKTLESKLEELIRKIDVGVEAEELRKENKKLQKEKKELEKKVARSYQTPLIEKIGSGLETTFGAIGGGFRAVGRGISDVFSEGLTFLVEKIGPVLVVGTLAAGVIYGGYKGCSACYNYLIVEPAEERETARENQLQQDLNAIERLTDNFENNLRQKDITALRTNIECYQGVWVGGYTFIESIVDRVLYERSNVESITVVEGPTLVRDFNGYRRYEVHWNVDFKENALVGNVAVDCRSVSDCSFFVLRDMDERCPPYSQED